MSAPESQPRRRVYPAGPIKRLHVHQQRLRSGQPALIVRTSRGSESMYWTTVTVNGETRLVQPGGKLSCGARAWMETTDEVVAVLDDPADPE